MATVTIVTGQRGPIQRFRCPLFHALPLAFQDRLRQRSDRFDVGLGFGVRSVVGLEPLQRRVDRLVQALMIGFERVDRQRDERARDRRDEFRARGDDADEQRIHVARLIANAALS